MEEAAAPVNKAVLSALHQPFWDRLANSKIVLISGRYLDQGTLLSLFR